MTEPVPQTPAEKIRQRRAQMLVHSFIYYVLNDSVVSDHQWQRWADELVQLQKEYPEPIGFYDKEFADWDASSGYHLPKDGWVSGEALWLLRFIDERRWKAKVSPSLESQ